MLGRDVIRIGAGLIVAGLACFSQTPGGGAAQPGATSAFDDELPPWLKPGVELRGRFERKMGLKYTPGNDDTYYVHRLRLEVAIEPSSWLRLFVQGQDAQAPGFSRKPTPTSFANTLDLRQGYVEAGRIEQGAWGLRVGRQELRFGEARLIGNSSWSNSSRSWDAVRLTLRQPGARLDWFAAALVPIVNGQFDRPRLRNGLYGFYSSFDRLIHESLIEPYLFWKTNARVKGEIGTSGDLDVYTGGVRAVGQLPHHLDYGVECAVQRGQFAGDRIRAWAGHWTLGYTLLSHRWTPRLNLEYNHASGDRNPGDGLRGTFDQLWPSNHDKYGTADRITWRNMNDLLAGTELRPTSKWRCRFEYHYFWLATTQDGMYTDGGVLIVMNRKAASRRIGPEMDLIGSYDVSGRLQIGFGYSHLFAGPYLRQSIKETGSTYPYVMWLYRL